MGMKLVKNYKDWIKQEWIDYFLSVDGSCYPRDADPEKEPGMVEAGILNRQPGTDIVINDGNESWDPQCVCCITYKQEELPFKVKLPFEIEHPHEWFFMKLKPGMMQPIHQDYSITGKMYIDGVAVSNKNNVLRYWMPLQNYKRGHLFFYDDSLFCDYNAGDLFLHEGEDVWHGGGNIGHSTRLTFNLTVYSNE
jgi:hypothetical protein